MEITTPNPNRQAQSLIAATGATVVLLGALVIMSVPDNAAEAAPAEPAPPEGRALATFGGGCFWCTEAVFEATTGVYSAVSGYSGGAIPNPSYQAVCSGVTGHAEVIQVAYNPEEISYSDLLEIFFKTHDPTTLNRQGADVGTQYRSVVFYHNDEQRRVAEEVMTALDASGAYSDKLVTEISPLEIFYPAEPYHQDYFARNPNQGYCRAVIAPKMDKFRKAFADRQKKL